MKIHVKYTRLHENAIAPSRPDEGSNGLDLYAHISENFGMIRIPPGEHRMIGTGIAIELPTGALGFVTPRSGLSAKHGVTVLNSPGLVDSSYRGEIKVILQNHSMVEYQVRDGERIAQLVVLQQGSVTLEEVGALNDTERGSNGFGSSGR